MYRTYPHSRSYDEHVNDRLKNNNYVNSCNYFHIKSYGLKKLVQKENRIMTIKNFYLTLFIIMTIFNIILLTILK